jgi:proline iminopeptidase
MAVCERIYVSRFRFQEIFSRIVLTVREYPFLTRAFHPMGNPWSTVPARTRRAVPFRQLSNGGDPMSEAENLFGDEHVRRYRETGGKVGHIWREGSTILLLTTTGRKSGEKRTVPLIYAQDGDRYVIVASKGGAPEHPGWYENLAKTRDVEVQVKDQLFRAHARDAQGEERARLWRLANTVWKSYDDYAKKTDREIPVVVLERT